MPNEADRPRRITVDRDGPLLIEGPVEVVGEDGTITASDRFVVALCTCRRSRAYPWCDTSHRAHRRPPTATGHHPTDVGATEDGCPSDDPKDSHDGDRR